MVSVRARIGTAHITRNPASDARGAKTGHRRRLSAALAAALLERQAGLARQPGRLDYPAEIKRWRAFAEQAEQMARGWEKQP